MDLFKKLREWAGIDKPKQPDFKAQEIDWGFVSEHIDEWMEKIELEYMG